MLHTLLAAIVGQVGGSDWVLEAKEAQPPLIHYVVLALGTLSLLLFVVGTVYLISSI